MRIVEKELSRGPEAARHARRAVEPLQGSLAPSRFGDLQLLISELVTNGIVHGSNPLGGNGPAGHLDLHVDVGDETVRVEVLQPGPAIELPRRAPPGSDWGFGLLLVERLAARWGMGDHPTMVWFEIDF